MSLIKQQRFAHATIIFEALIDSEEEEQMPRRKILWVKEWMKDKQLKSHTELLMDLKLTSPLDFQNYLRMDTGVYQELLEMVTLLIVKQDTQMRDAISPHERLVAPLRFLATGQSYTDMKFRSYIGKSTLSIAIIDPCVAIINVLKDYIHLPTAEEEWKVVAEEFEVLWNFPHCIGAIDGKHVNIVKPKDGGSYYFNYLKTHSIVLMATANAKDEFLTVDVGANGRVSDGGVLTKSKLGILYKDVDLNIPTPCTITPIFFVADDAFPLGVHETCPHEGYTTIIVYLVLGV